jgi:hypothetical protein
MDEDQFTIIMSVTKKATRSQIQSMTPEQREAYMRMYFAVIAKLRKQFRELKESK